MVFDSEYMVFVSPPPAEKSKAVAPIMPFNIYVRIYYLFICSSTYLFISTDVGCGDRHTDDIRFGYSGQRLDPLRHRPGQGGTIVDLTSSNNSSNYL